MRSPAWKLSGRIDVPKEGFNTALLTAEGRTAVVAGYGGDVRVIDVDAARVTHVLKGHTSILLAGVIAPDRRTCATTGNDGSVRVWDIVEGKQMLRSGHQRPPQGALHLHGIVYSPDGAAIWTSGWERFVRKWDATTGKQLAQAHVASDISAQCWLSPDGKRLFVAGMGIHVFDAERAREVKTLDAACGTDDDSAYVTEDSKTLVVVGRDRTIRHIDIATGEERKPIPVACEEEEEEWQHSFFFSPDRSLVATDAPGGVIRVFEAATGREVFSAPGNSPEADYVGGIAFSADNSVMVSADNAGTVVLWKRARATAGK